MSENSKAYKISIRECKHCGVGFCSGYALSEHYKTCDSKVKPEREAPENAVDCEECNVRFPTHADLIQHNQYHQGTHKYLCRICSRSYQSNPGRLKHEQLEHGSQPLLHCDACGKQFKRKDRLKDHVATKHSVATPHKCPYCDAAFKLRDYLRKHVNQSHAGQSLASTNSLKAKANATQVEEPEEAVVGVVSVVLDDGKVDDVEMNECMNEQAIHVVVQEPIE